MARFKGQGKMAWFPIRLRSVGAEGTWDRRAEGPAAADAAGRRCRAALTGAAASTSQSPRRSRWLRTPPGRSHAARTGDKGGGVGRREGPPPQFPCHLWGGSYLPVGSFPHPLQHHNPMAGDSVPRSPNEPLPARRSRLQRPRQRGGQRGLRGPGSQQATQGTAAGWCPRAPCFSGQYF